MNIEIPNDIVRWVNDTTWHPKYKDVTAEQEGEGRTVLFHFEQKGFNAHVADGSFTYDTPEQAQKVAERMNLSDHYTNVRIV